MTIALGMVLALASAGTAQAQKRAAAAGGGDYTPSWAGEIGDTVIADFVALEQSKLAALDALMEKPCGSADCKDMQQTWWSTIDELLAEFRTARDQARMAYIANNRRPPSAVLPNKYSQWFTDQQEQWVFLRNKGGVVFLWIKQVQRMTAENIVNNIPGATYSLKWFVEQTKAIDEAVGVIRGVRDKNLAKRYVSQYKPIRDLAKLVSEVHKTWSRDEKRYLEKADPKQYDNYKAFYAEWKAPEDGMYFPYKESWSKRVEKTYKDYKKSYKALFAVADPVIEGDFMNDNGRIKHWKPGDIGDELGKLFAELERRAN